MLIWVALIALVGGYPIHTPGRKALNGADKTQAMQTQHGGTFTYRINQPNVTQAQTDYPDETFKGGDVVVISAGGCVQTGGRGKTWKRYVDPIGLGADHLYYGLVAIPGMIETPVRLSTVIGRQLTVPETISSTHLILGYADDDYSDNGYSKPDNGVDDQCAGVGDAFVEVRVTRRDSVAHVEPHVHNNEPGDTSDKAMHKGTRSLLDAVVAFFTSLPGILTGTAAVMGAWAVLRGKGKPKPV